MAIVKGTISGIEEHKGEIYEIYDHTRKERDDIKCRIGRTSEELKKREFSRAKLESEEQMLKQELASASQKYSEEEIEKAYDRLLKLGREKNDMEARVERLMVEREQLIAKEHHLNTMYIQAEHYSFAIGAALTYLSQELEGLAFQLDDLETEKYLGVRVIKAQEEERRRLSRELHDGPLQEMTTMLYETVVSEKLVNRDPDGAIENIQKLRRDLRATMSNMRQLIFDIRPMALDDQGLVGATKELCANLLERNIIAVNFITSGDERKLPMHTQVAIFRIVQESINNVARHSGAKEAKVVFRYGEEQLEIMVEDKGVGFDIDAVKNEVRDTEEHFGLISMRERAELIGAKIKLNSEKGRGTVVSLVVPYGKQ